MLDIAEDPSAQPPRPGGTHASHRLDQPRRRPHRLAHQMTATVHHGDCLDVLRELPDNSVDAIVTDPPYGLGFMGQKWDTYANETGRAKSTKDHKFDHVGGNHNPSNSADAARTRRVEGQRFGEWCSLWTTEAFRVLKPGGHLLTFGGTRTWHRLAVAVEDAGFEVRDSIAWLYGSGFPKAKGQLKPAHEPIVVARRPLSGTVAANVLAHGTGALNIDGTRVGAPEDKRAAGTRRYISHGKEPGADGGEVQPAPHDGKGRWPTNVVLDDHAAAELDATGPHTKDGVAVNRNADGGRKRANVYGDYGNPAGPDVTYGGQGGPSRFFPVFRYQAKAPARERIKVNGVAHPTVKPLALMRWLVRLVTPPGGVVLDPFAGSGTTVEACLLEGFRCIAIEREADYLPLIHARIARVTTADDDDEATA